MPALCFGKNVTTVLSFAHRRIHRHAERDKGISLRGELNGALLAMPLTIWQ